jgi:hypothetical protein
LSPAGHVSSEHVPRAPLSAVKADGVRMQQRNPPDKAPLSNADWNRRTGLAFAMGGPIGAVFALLARYVPWVIAYVLGPGVLIGCGWFFLKFRTWFFFPKGDGPGGFVSLILWPLLIVALWLGWLLISTGRHLLQERRGGQGSGRP